MIYENLPKLRQEDILTLLEGWKDRSLRPSICKAIYTNHRSFIIGFYDILLEPLDSKERGDIYFKKLLLNAIGTHTKIKHQTPKYFGAEICAFVLRRWTKEELEAEFYPIFCHVLDGYLRKLKPRAQLFPYVIKYLTYGIRDWIVCKVLAAKNKPEHLEYSDEDLYDLPMQWQSWERQLDTSFDNAWIFNLRPGTMSFTDQICLIDKALNPKSQSYSDKLSDRYSKSLIEQNLITVAMQLV